MTPPNPTQPVATPRSSRLPAMLPPLVALAAVVVLAGLAYWQESPVPAPKAPKASRSANAAQELHRDAPADGYAGAFDRGMGGYFGPRSSDDLLRVRATDEPMTDNPASLPLLPDREDRAAPVRQAAFRRVVGDVTEEVATWWAPEADAEEVRQFYRQAAVGLGFSPVERGPAAARDGSSPRHPHAGKEQAGVARALQNTFVRESERGREVLTIRLSPDSAGGVRVLLWLGYPMSARR